MSGILDKYDESINLTYNYTYRMLTHLKNIRDNYLKLEDADDITLEDLVWKLLSKIFKADGLEINNPRGCYKQAFKEGLIEDMVIWNDILLARNSTAHIYDENDYEAIKNDIIERYLGAIENLLNKISMEKL